MVPDPVTALGGCSSGGPVKLGLAVLAIAFKSIPLLENSDISSGFQLEEDKNACASAPKDLSKLKVGFLF